MKSDSYQTSIRFGGMCGVGPKNHCCGSVRWRHRLSLYSSASCGFTRIRASLTKPGTPHKPCSTLMRTSYRCLDFSSNWWSTSRGFSSNPALPTTFRLRSKLRIDSHIASPTSGCVLSRWARVSPSSISRAVQQFAMSAIFAASTGRLTIRSGSKAIELDSMWANGCVPVSASVFVLGSGSKARSKSSISPNAVSTWSVGLDGASFWATRTSGRQQAVA